MKCKMPDVFGKIGYQVMQFYYMKDPVRTTAVSAVIIEITITRLCNAILLQFYTAVKKNCDFFSKIVIFFLIFAKNIDCGYTLEAPQ